MMKLTASSLGLVSFLSPQLVSYLCVLVSANDSTITTCVYILLAHVTSVLLLLLYNQGHSFFQLVALHSTLLSFVFMLGFHLLLVNSESWPLTLLGLYLITLSFFHYSEFLITAINHPKSVDIDAFLLNNKLEYHLNIAASLVEFGLESYYFSAWKFSCLYLVWTGLALIVFGETVRKLAMLTAGRSFTHIIRQKKGDLELVVTGVYSLCRHPSYVGWFYWVIGTQLLLVNPICLVAFTIVSWKFFKQRIFSEEYYLIGFFGDQYRQYKCSVPTGLPFIKGYY